MRAPLISESLAMTQIFMRTKVFEIVCVDGECTSALFCFLTSIYPVTGVLGMLMFGLLSMNDTWASKSWLN